MKRIFITTTILLPTIVFSQNLQITYDFSKDTTKTKPSKTYWVKEKNGIDFRIENINLFNYQVNINNAKQDYVNEENSKFTENKFTDIKALDMISTQFIFGITQAENYTINLIQYDLKSIDNIKDKREIEGRSELKTSINTFILELDNLRNSPSTKGIVAGDWLRQAVLYYNSLYISLHSSDSLEERIKSRDKLTLTFYNKIILNNGDHFKDIVGYTQLISLRQREIERIDKRIKDCKQVLSRINTIEEIINENKEHFTQSFIGDLSSIKLLVLNMYESYQKALDALMSEKINELAIETQRLYSSFSKDNDEIHLKEYDLRNVDIIKLDVSIDPREKGVAYITRKEKFSTIIKTYGGIRFDVSAGLMFNFNLNNRSYYYDSSGFNSDTVKIYEKKENNTYLPFIGSQLNVYWNKPWKNPLSPGLSIGVSTNMTDLRYYLGLCLVMGNKDRIVLSGGLVGGKVEVLSGQYDLDKPYKFSNLPDKPETEAAFRIGSYLSLTYNLTSNKAKSFGDNLISKKE